MTAVMRTLLVASSGWLSAILLATVNAAPPAVPAQRTQATSPPEGPMFAPSSECVACHNNLVTSSGEDVSIGASWRGTMMANAGRDPYVLASIRRETMDHSSRARDVEDECATCHLPAAQKMAHANGGKAAVFAHFANANRPLADIDDKNVGRLNLAWSAIRLPPTASGRETASTAISSSPRRVPTACAWPSGRWPSIQDGGGSCTR